MGPNAAVWFESFAFDMSGKKLMGAQSASHGFLQAFTRHAQVDRLYCLTKTQGEFNTFRKLLAAWSVDPNRPVEWLAYDKLERIAEPGCLYHPNPALTESAWLRRHIGERAYSLCGVTHTTCSAAAMDTFGAFMIAPLQEWDAVVCTSNSVRATLDRVLGHWNEYLAERLHARPVVPFQLPIIPLGVDCDRFERLRQEDSLRRKMRSELGIADDDVAFLFLGRLSFHAKAHPLPMYLALEEAARRTGKRVHLVQAGWFPNDAVQREFAAGAQRYCPSVRMVFLDGRRPEVRERIWFAGDVFTSLADNIQETFGMVPIEAMAAGLPQVISDWDGYRDTVRADVDGFRISTIMPPGGTGEDIAYRHAAGVDTYDRYIAHASQCTAVDWRECAEAYVKLIESPDLRRSMGETGRQRARERFDWPVIVRAYQQLWAELADRRRHAADSAKPKPPHPLREDPFALFTKYATHILDETTVLEMAGGANESRFDEIYASGLVNYVGAPFLLATADELRSVLARLSAAPQTVAALLELTDPNRRSVVHRSLGWLFKAGLVQMVSTGDAESGG